MTKNYERKTGHKFGHLLPKTQRVFFIKIITKKNIPSIGICENSVKVTKKYIQLLIQMKERLALESQLLWQIIYMM